LRNNYNNFTSSSSDDENSLSYHSDFEREYSDEESVNSSDSARWREGEDYNDHHEMLNDDLKNALSLNDISLAKSILDEIDPALIEIDSDEIKSYIFEHESPELFDLATSYAELCPNYKVASEWLESAIESRSIKLLSSICDYFQIPDSEILIYLHNSQNDYHIPDIVLVCLKYLLNNLSKEIGFNEELQKCVDLYRDGQDIELRIITAMQYESMRHADNSLAYKLRKTLLGIYSSELSQLPKSELFKYLEDEETRNHNYFGSYLSDDSDDELSDSELPEDEIRYYGDLAKKSGITKFLKKLKDFDEFEDIDIDSGKKKIMKSLESIKLNFQATQLQKDDLDSLNGFLRDDNDPNQLPEFLLNCSTKFCLHFYRGISYYTNQWNQPSRRHNKSTDEATRPIFSYAAYKGANIKIDDVRIVKTEDMEPSLNHHASLILTKKKELENKANCFWEGWKSNRPFLNGLHLFHDIYTNSYDSFQMFLRETESGINGNPLVSTSENPRHPFNYAMGNKVYQGHENKRLRPRWNVDGRAERPHSGKVYSILIPLEELGSSALVSVPQLNYQGHISVNNIIISERETSFWGKIDGRYVVEQKVARYPSFDKPYNSKYLKKYGLSKPEYDAFRELLACHSPHSKTNRLAKTMLGCYLSNFYELCTHENLVRISYDKGCMPVYQNIDGTFSFTQGYDSPNRNGVSPEVKTAYAARKKNGRRSLEGIQPREISFNDELIDEMRNLSI